MRDRRKEPAMEQNERFALFARLRSAVLEYQKHCPSEPLAICGNPKTVKQLEKDIKEFTTYFEPGPALFGVPFFVFEELPDKVLFIKTLTDVQQILKERISWMEWLRHGE
jgi:hypothetical protein